MSPLRADLPLPPARFVVLISVRGWVDLRATARLEGLGQLKKSNDLIRNRTRGLPACSIVPQPTTLPRAPYSNVVYEKFVLWYSEYLAGDTNCWKANDTLGTTQHSFKNYFRRIKLQVTYSPYEKRFQIKVLHLNQISLLEQFIIRFPENRKDVNQTQIQTADPLRVYKISLKSVEQFPRQAEIRLQSTGRKEQRGQIRVPWYFPAKPPALALVYRITGVYVWQLFFVLACVLYVPIPL
jgi:hypothetical protein